MVETRASRSRAVEEAETQVSRHKRTPPSPPRTPQTQIVQPTQSAQFEGDIVSRLMSFLISLQET